MGNNCILVAASTNNVAAPSGLPLSDIIAVAFIAGGVAIPPIPSIFALMFNAIRLSVSLSVLPNNNRISGCNNPAILSVIFA